MWSGQRHPGRHESCGRCSAQADGGRVEPSRPLFRPDAGWLFLVAGLALVLAAAIIPSERQLHELRTQLDELKHAERTNFAIMGAYARFVDDLDDRDPSLLRRLAASQLNVIPRDETPLLMASTVNASVPEWIEATVEVEPFKAPPPADTVLARWTEGRGRLWAIGAGGMLVFMGLLLGPSGARRDPDAECTAADSNDVDGSTDEDFSTQSTDESSEEVVSAEDPAEGHAVGPAAQVAD